MHFDVICMAGLKGQLFFPFFFFFCICEHKVSGSKHKLTVYFTEYTLIL